MEEDLSITEYNCRKCGVDIEDLKYCPEKNCSKCYNGRCNSTDNFCLKCCPLKQIKVIKSKRPNEQPGKYVGYET